MRGSRVVVFSMGMICVLVSRGSAALIAPDQPVAGQSQLSMAEQWCRWNIMQSVATNPIFDNTGAQAFRGDQGSVFFLTADETASPIVRNITVPAGVPLFTPIVAETNDNTTAPGQPPTTYTAAQLLSMITPFFDPQNESIFLQIDGVAQPNLYSYRQTTDPSAPFSYTTTSRDNYIDVVNGADSTLGTGVFPSTVSPVVEDGYWIALEPFAPGSTHMLHFGGTGGGYGEDITYNITTAPEPTGALLIVVPCMIALARRTRRSCVGQ